MHHRIHPHTQRVSKQNPKFPFVKMFISALTWLDSFFYITKVFFPRLTAVSSPRQVSCKHFEEHRFDGENLGGNKHSFFRKKTLLLLENPLIVWPKAQNTNYHQSHQNPETPIHQQVPRPKPPITNPP